MKLPVSLLALSGLVLACGNEATQVQVRDVRLAPPAPDPQYHDIVAPEITIQPGEDKMYCYSLTYEGDDLATDYLEVEQGPFGHHVVLLSSKAPEPDGTLADCSDAKDMWKYRSLILPETGLPEGHAVRLRKGTKFVFQFHYVNTSETPILVRDYARIKKKPMSEVTTWTATFTSNSLRLNIPADGPATETFDCTLTQSSKLLLLGGHMHEEGDHMEIYVGPDVNNLAMLYEVKEWRADYRDAPPVELFLTQPKELNAGTIIRTSCTWKQNKTGAAVGFPSEMCSGFGYVAGIEEPVHCEASVQ